MTRGTNCHFVDFCRRLACCSCDVEEYSIIHVVEVCVCIDACPVLQGDGGYAMHGDYKIFATL